MQAPQRLVTTFDVDTTSGPDGNTDRKMSLLAVHQLELQGGHRITLLEGCGWSADRMGPGDIWAATSLQTLVVQARAVVGPGEPPTGRSHQQQTALHWDFLSELAERQGVLVSAETLAGLMHDVEIGRALQDRVALARQAAATGELS